MLLTVIDWLSQISKSTSGKAATGVSESPAVVNFLDDDYVIENESPLRVLTWNIWSSSLEAAARMAAVASIMEQERPHIVALQEVTLALEALLRENGAFDDYCEAPAERGLGETYTLMFARKSNASWMEASRKAFPNSRDGRDHLSGLVEWNGLVLHVTNVHLESSRGWSPDDKGSKERREQAQAVLEDLRHASDSLVVGDFNWAASDGEFPTLPEGAVDVWSRQKPDDHGFTYDIERNHCVRSKHGCRERPDRLLLGMRFLCPAHVRLVGTDTCPGTHQTSGLPVMPSDHFGVVCDFGRPRIPAAEAGWTCIREAAPLSTLESPEVQYNNDIGDENWWICSNCSWRNRSVNLVCGGAQIGFGCKVGTNPNPWWRCSCGFVNRPSNRKCGGEFGSMGCKQRKFESH